MAALVLLALNDHFLKQAGLLPGWLTGKLSDFAGLYVAPVLLAALLRLRSPGGLLACHGAVLSVFAAINLDAGAAVLWSRAMGVLGFPWEVTTDPTDLCALPALLASWRARKPALQGPAKTRVRRVLQYGLAGVGLLFCMATSDGVGALWVEGPHLHNTSSDELTVLVRALRDSVALDCAAIAEDPGSRIPDAAFGVAVAHRIGPRGNIEIGRAFDQGCSAFHIGGSGLTPAIVFVRGSDELTQGVPARYDSRDEWLDGAIVIEFEGARHTGYASVGGDFVFDIDRTLADIGAACAPANEAARPAVTWGLGTGRLRLVAVDEGPDGCVALRAEPAPAPALPPDEIEADGGVDLDEDAGDAGPVDASDAGPVDAGDAGSNPGQPGPAAYVCVPSGMFPFLTGEVVEVQAGLGGRGRWTMIREDEAGQALTELHVLPLIEAGDYVARVDLLPHARTDCPYVRNETCAQTSTPAEVELRAGEQRRTLRPGDTPATFELSGDASVRVAVPLAQSRVLLDTACADGARAPDFDAAAVVVVRWGGE